MSAPDPDQTDAVPGGTAASPAGHGPKDLGERQLRIAPVMTGGTSLAVWMGGVTAELYRLVGAEPSSDPTATIYEQLLAVTGTNAIVDVITGTSAGGLNGVLLATAWTYQLDPAKFLSMREVWMRLGAIDQLIRPATERNPPSLLKGDAYFWSELTDVLNDLAALSAHETDPKTDVELLVTMTSLKGEPTHRVDDLGSDLNEITYAQHVRFGSDGFRGADWARRIALAARTSASIPGVFEASFLPYGDDEVKGRPGFEHSDPTFHGSRWAVDGGVLVNKPLRYALDRIFKRPADRELRRVVLYVNPTPDDPTTPDDSLAAPPTILDAVTSIFGTPRNEEIAGDIDRLREFDDAARRAVDVRLTIARLMNTTPGATTPLGTAPDAAPVSVDQLEVWARHLYPAFIRSRVESSVEAMLSRNAPPELVRRSLERDRIERALRAAASAGWLQSPTFPTAITVDWPWGIAPLDYVAAMLFDLIGRAYDVLQVGQTREREALGEIRERVGRALAAIEGVREWDDAYWRVCVAKENRKDPRQLGSGYEPALAEWAADCYEYWPDPTAFLSNGTKTSETTKATATSTLLQHALELAAAATDLGPLLATSKDPDLGLQSALLGITPGPGPAPAVVLRRLLALHVVAVGFGDATRRPHRISIAQVSWRAPNSLVVRSPDQKLAGNEFSRLGAFVKPSWRANDWMWGRFDGAFQLVLLLLDPARLCQLFPSDPAAPVRTLLERDPGIPDALRAGALEELERFDATDPPSSLPKTARALAWRLQVEIAREELPHVYEAVVASNALGGGEKDNGRFRRTFETARQSAGGFGSAPETAIVRTLEDCRIGEETAADELGRDMLTRTVGQVAAVAGNALTGDRSGLGWPARIAWPIRQLGLATYAVTRVSTTDSNTARTLAGIVFGTAGAVLGMRLLGTGLNPGVVILASLVLAIGMLTTTLRSRVWGLLPAVVAFVVVGLTMVGGRIRLVITTPVLPEKVPAWKTTFLLGPTSVATIALVIGLVLLVRPAVRRWPTSAAAGFRALLTVAVAIALWIFHDDVFRFLFTGTNDGWRHWTVNAARWLHHRDTVVIVALLILVGMLWGLAYDRGIRRVWSWIRRGLHALGG